MNKPLTVYKASAGSGKTFTLAVEFIKLLVVNPLSYRNILAVTFTNKATEEMKMRILSQLYGIWKSLPDSQSYIDKICQSTGLGKEMAAKNAGIALSNILHDYSRFRIETIDSFFQSVLRNLARELELTVNLRVSLNDEQVKELAVDEMIEDLTQTDDVLSWIISYIHERITDDKSWNVIGSIKTFGKTIFKDTYKEHAKSLKEFMETKGKFDEYVKCIKKEQKDAVDTMRQIAEKFIKATDKHGITIEDLYQKNRGVYGYFLKLADGQIDTEVNSYVTACLEDPDKWCNKKHPNEAYIHSVVVNELHAILQEAVDQQKIQKVRYMSSMLTLRHLNQMRLLNHIENKVRQLNTEANRFMLSDTQHLLQSLIDNSDSPFIFEKIGTQLHHIMIDEFQDTSTVQWKNFKVLLLECMSHEGSQNLIVGDVKQSIYRFRSGDWRLLNNISDEFGNNEELIKVEPLSVNYRSLRNVINFNNEFFTTAMSHQTDDTGQISNAYSDVVQMVPDSKPYEGYVRIDLLADDDYDEKTLEIIADHVSGLLNKGSRQKDICILVRYNSQIPLIADYLIKHINNITIVSDEAFQLSASTAVLIMIKALKVLSNPNDDITKGELVKAYNKHILGNNLSDNVLLISNSKLNEWLPEAFINNIEGLKRMPLFNLCQTLHTIFNLDKLAGESAYICTFYDKLQAYITELSSDINGFLREWEEKLHKENIQGTDVDGIRIMTMHKSKGLEAESVILPYCDWKLEKTKNNILLCNTNVPPFSDLALVPIDYSSRMEGSVYALDYYEEKLQNSVDNLNLLYVAFTRARRNLFIIGKDEKKDDEKKKNGKQQDKSNKETLRSDLILLCLKEVSERLEKINPEISNCIISNQGGGTCFEYGEITISNEKETVEKTENVFLQDYEKLPIELKQQTPHLEFKQSNDSKHFIENIDDDSDDSAGYIKIGSVLHNVLSNITTIADVDDALKKLENDGVLYDENISFEKISSMLRKRLASPRVADWYSGKWEVFNECTILSLDSSTGLVIEKRPDRVMRNGDEVIVVDFKFGKENDDYRKQVRFYMEKLEEMGYNNVKGVLWYVYANKFVEV